MLFREPAGGRVAGLLSGRRLVAPTLLRYELASVSRKKRRLYPPLRDEFFAMLGAWRRMGIDEVQVDPEGAVTLAELLDVTVYDAAYLWLARHVRAPIVTLDETMRASASQLGLPAP